MPNVRMLNPGMPRVVGGPFSPDPEDDLVPGVSFGADQAIANKQRELALAGLDVAMQDTRRAAEPDFMQQQRANIASHGTIETPHAFKRRMGMEDAADLMSPATSVGRLRADEERAALGKIYQSNVRPAEINAGVQREKIQNDFDTAVVGADIEAETGRYRADAEAQATLEKELANQVIGNTFKNGPRERDDAIAGFMTALDDLRRKHAKASTVRGAR